MTHRQLQSCLAETLKALFQLVDVAGIRACHGSAVGRSLAEPAVRQFPPAGEGQGLNPAFAADAPAIGRQLVDR